jgi:Putative transposase DNA-binding domain
MFKYARYKAWNASILTSRVSPRNTSCECARCGSLVARYAEGEPAEGYTPGVPLVLCPACGMRGHANRNASLRVGHRLITRSQQPTKEKPLAPLATEREEKSSGVGVCQEAKSEERPSIFLARCADANGPGTAREGEIWMEASLSAISHQLRLFAE